MLPQIQFLSNSEVRPGEVQAQVLAMKSEDQNRVNDKLETKRIFKRYGTIAEKTTQENNITEGHLHE